MSNPEVDTAAPDNGFWVQMWHLEGCVRIWHKKNIEALMRHALYEGFRLLPCKYMGDIFLAHFCPWDFLCIIGDHLVMGTSSRPMHQGTELKAAQIGF